MNEIWSLFSTFFLIACVTFGGGYAALPILIREIVVKRQWIGEEDLLDYYAVSQTTPGVILVNVSTFMGYRRKGFWGAAAATLGVVLPSLIIITTVAAVLSNFSSLPWVRHAFAGIRVAVSALIASTVWDLAKKNVRTWLKAVIAAFALAAVALLHVSPIYVTLAFAAFGALWFGRRRDA